MEPKAFDKQLQAILKFHVQKSDFCFTWQEMSDYEERVAFHSLQVKWLVPNPQINVK